MTRQTIDFAKSLDLDFAQFAITVPFPGSQMFEDLRGAPESRRRENWTTFQPDPEKMVFVPREVSLVLDQDAKAGTEEFFLRPKMVYRHLVEIRTINANLHGARGMSCRMTIDDGGLCRLSVDRKHLARGGTDELASRRFRPAPKPRPQG